MAAEVVPVRGTAHERFRPVLDVLARTVAAQGGGGAALVVRHGGDLLVDASAGDYAEDALQLVFSVGKAMTAVAAAMVSAAGDLDLDEPLGTYWPEFSRPSTSTITPRLVLSHRSGIPTLDRALTLDELVGPEAERAVEAQEPYWEPGTRHGYHAVTFGILMDGVFRRRLGRTVSQFVADEIAGPLGIDVAIGATETTQDRLRAVRYSPPAITAGRADFLARSPLPVASTGRLAATMDLWNSPELLRSTLPSTAGIASARGLADLLAATLDGRLLSTESTAAMTATQARGPDEVLGVDMHYGTGMQRPFPQFPMFGRESFGHEAAGGSFAIADPVSGLSIAWVTDTFPPMAGATPAAVALLSSIRHCWEG